VAVSRVGRDADGDQEILRIRSSAFRGGDTGTDGTYPSFHPVRYRTVLGWARETGERHVCPDIFMLDSQRPQYSLAFLLRSSSCRMYRPHDVGAFRLRESVGRETRGQTECSPIFRRMEIGERPVCPQFSPPVFPVFPSASRPTRETATGGASCVVLEYGWASPQGILRVMWRQNKGLIVVGLLVVAGYGGHLLYRYIKVQQDANRRAAAVIRPVIDNDDVAEIGYVYSMRDEIYLREVPEKNLVWFIKVPATGARYSCQYEYGFPEFRKGDDVRIIHPRDLTEGSGEGYIIGLHEKLTGKTALVNVNDEEELEMDIPEPDLPDPE